MDLPTWRAQFAPEISGESPSIVDALTTLQRVADCNVGIMITGETGTGKEMFARVIHRASARRGRPFVAVNCAAIPETLLETELFGHIKGAYTGATNARPGRFMTANEGTIFLDEIGDMSLAAQAKLLRVLEERVVNPVGSDADIPVDVRVVAATHRNLEEMVAQGKFRADLFFRLTVVPIQLPPLRERHDDIQRLAELFVARSCARVGRRIDFIDPAARTALADHAWPGNVRELAHVIERAVLLARRPHLTVEDLRLPMSQLRSRPAGTDAPPIVDETVAAVATDSCLDLRTALEQVERDLITRALQRANGNRTEAAALLGLNRTTLVEKLRKYAA
jgi:two-component system response regulator AtoC